MRKFTGLLIGLLLVVIVGSIMECSGKSETERELIVFWGKETVNFFENIDCADLQFEPYELNFNKLFLIRGNCELWKKESWELNFKEFNNSSTLADFLTKDISKADIIVWLNVLQNGTEYGNYSNGAKAIRNNIEVNLIDINNKKIFKKQIFESLGDPPKEILRNQNENRPEYFGSIPFDQISDFLLRELEK